MATKTIGSLSEMLSSGADPANDVLEVEDVGAGASKKLKLQSLAGAIAPNLAGAGLESDGGSPADLQVTANLRDVSGLSVADGTFIVGNGSNFVSESGATARASIGANDASNLTTGTLADARVTQSNVTQHEGAIDHGALTNFVANEHIDHSGVSISAGTGLSGGGDITASRTLNLFAATSNLTDAASPNATAAGQLLIWHGANSQFENATLTGGSGITVTNSDASITLAADEANIDHDSLQNFVANEHVDHSGVSVSAGNGLTGGGNITASRTLAIATDGVKTDEIDLAISPTWTGTHTFRNAVFQPSSDGTQLYPVRDAAGNNLVEYDTTNSKFVVRELGGAADDRIELSYSNDTVKIYDGNTDGQGTVGIELSKSGFSTTKLSERGNDGLVISGGGSDVIFGANEIVPRNGQVLGRFSGVDKELGGLNSKNKIEVRLEDSSEVASVFRGALSQSANLIELQDSDGNALTAFGPSARPERRGDDGGGTNRMLAAWSASFTDAAAASFKTRGTLLANDFNGEREAIRWEGDGSQALLSFFGGTAVAKQSALTAKDASTVDSTYGTEERDVIRNNRTRIEEIETRLQNYNLVA